MSTSSQVFCTCCRRYKPSDQFNQARNGRLYKTCRECSESRRRQPLGEIDPNSRSLRSGVRRPTVPIRQSRQPKRRHLDPILTPEPTHAPVRAAQGPTETVNLTFSPTRAPVQAIPTPEPTYAPVQAGQRPSETVDLTFSTTRTPVQAAQGPTDCTLSPTPTLC
jgi:hypothetical protein